MAEILTFSFPLHKPKELNNAWLIMASLFMLLWEGSKELHLNGLGLFPPCLLFFRSRGRMNSGAKGGVGVGEKE